MKEEIKALWLAELRSGRRTQGHQRLRDNDGGECCLGVLCDLAVQAGIGRWVDAPDGPRFVSTDDPADWSMGVLPASVIRWADLDSSDPEVVDSRPSGFEAPVRLSGLNDEGWSFAAIADEIERGL